MNLACRVLLAHKGLDRRRPQWADDLGMDQCDLGLKVWVAGIYFRLSWSPVVWRPAFYNVCDEDLTPVQPDRGQEFCQIFPRGSDEGSSLLVLLLSRTLAHKHHDCSNRPFSWNGFVPALVQVALGTGHDCRMYCLQLFGQRLHQ